MTITELNELIRDERATAHPNAVYIKWLKILLAEAVVEKVRGLPIDRSIRLGTQRGRRTLLKGRG